MMKKSIVLVGGGTGGHFFCMLALAQAMSKSFSLSEKIACITDIRCKKYIQHQESDVEYMIIKSVKLEKKIFSLLRFFFVSAFEVFKLLFVFMKKKPAFIVGFGGYVCFAPLIVAIITRVPIFLYEQNVVMGRANKFFAKFAKKIFFSLGVDNNIEQSYRSKSVLVNTSIRNQIIKESGENVFFSDSVKYKNCLKILILGGSAGASIFSEMMQNVLSRLIESGISADTFCVIQQCRKKDIQSLTNFYIRNKIPNFILKDFFNNIEKCYFSSDLVISRAGANAISEIMYTNTPALLVPFPHAVANHQEKNALFLKKFGMCWHVKQGENCDESIYGILKDIIKKPELLAEKKNAISKFVSVQKPDILEVLKECINLM